MCVCTECSIVGTVVNVMHTTIVHHLMSSMSRLGPIHAYMYTHGVFMFDEADCLGDRHGGLGLLCL